MVITPLITGSSRRAPASTSTSGLGRAPQDQVEQHAYQRPRAAPPSQLPARHSPDLLHHQLPAISETNATPTSPELTDLLSRIAERLAEAVKAPMCAVLLVDRETGVPHPVAWTGATAPSVERLPGLDPEQPPGDIQLDAVEARATTSSVVIPIPGASIPLGALLVDGLRVPATAMERDYLALAARLTGIAIERERMGGLQQLTWRQIEAALDLRDAPVVARSSAGRIVHINAAARAMLGLGADDPISQVEVTRLLRSLDLRDQWGQRVQLSMLPNARLLAGLPAPDLVVSCRPADDQARRWVLLQGIAHTDAHGNIALVVTLMRDFTAIQLYDASQRLRARVAQHLCTPPVDFTAVEREIGAFVDGSCSITLYSHELGPTAESPRQTAAMDWRKPWRRDDRQPACEAGIELSRLGGHLYRASHPRSEHERWMSAPVGHLVAVPIRAATTHIGTMTCRRSARQPAFTLQETRLLHELAGQVGLSVTIERLRRSLDADEERITDISRRLVVAEEMERRRMALSIHDGLAQVATSVCRQLELLAQRLTASGDDAEAELERALALAHRTVQEARQLMANLRPATLDGQGLTAAVSEEVQRMRADGWTVRYVDGVSDSRYDPEVELALYRIIQESLANVRKHAGAVPVEVLMEQTGNAIRVHILDHGPGFDPNGIQGTSFDHVGLMGMRERIQQLDGTILIDSERGRGTRVTATVPLHSRLARG